ncbi:hypothetical protein ENCLCP370B_24040 [Enterobacter cloacae]
MEDFHFSISAFQIKLRHFSSILRQQYLCYPTLSLGFTVFLETAPIGPFFFFFCIFSALAFV